MAAPPHDPIEGSGVFQQSRWRRAPPSRGTLELALPPPLFFKRMNEIQTSISNQTASETRTVHDFFRGVLLWLQRPTKLRLVALAAHRSKNR
jgi:hypothetical protein